MERNSVNGPILDFSKFAEFLLQCEILAKQEEERRELEPHPSMWGFLLPTNKRKQEDISVTISPKLLDDTYRNCEKIGGFLKNMRGPKNDLSGKYKLKLVVLKNVFDSSWENIPTKGGHQKLKHRVTEVVINFQDHKDPVDPGAAETVSLRLQNHINIFYEKYLGYPARDKNKYKPNFEALSKKLKSKAHS